ncbi:hypothetical protein BDR04DRAFT_1161289 [Suillus decipiens]|nr:hypothetical protein BDR04DRAFT_1161289 [Suillus decipiens]
MVLTGGDVAPPITDNEPRETAGNTTVPAGPSAAVPHPAATTSTISAFPYPAAATSMATTSAVPAATTSAISTTPTSAAHTSNAGKCPHPDAFAEIETTLFGSSHISMQPFSTTLVVLIPPSKQAAKITPATAVVGMQGSINQMTDSFEALMRGAGSEDIVMHAIDLLDGEHGDIPIDQ